MYLHVSWSLQSIVYDDNIQESSLSSLLSKRDTLFEQLKYFLDISPRNYGNVLTSRVCIILAETCMVLVQGFKFSSTKLESLGFCPDVDFVKQFWKLCEQQLDISDETEDEGSNREYIEETNRDAVMIATAKLVATDSAPKVLSNSTKPLGIEILEARGICTNSHWFWIGAGALVGYVILLNVLFTVALAYLNRQMQRCQEKFNWHHCFP